MVFSSIFFLYFFLPVTLLLYFVVGQKYKNLLLLSASLIFYAWGEMAYVFLMLFSITVNWAIGLLIDRAKKQGRSGKRALVLGVVINLLPLAFFKYGNFFADNINIISTVFGFDKIELENIHLPIGISFFTFQAISYIVDIYRREAELQRNPVNLALYISLFPQLIAGPIVRYHDVAKQILKRQTTVDDFRYGILRFVAGLAKKVLIANNMGAVADHIFSLPPGELSASLAWLGLIAYSLQIYYDFSGYSDMAIGLGRMFGFHFLENFNYPYISRSIREFWQRWHISLSSWFRDYLYIPLGGNRKGLTRTYVNLLIVFFLTGLWHGASWAFVFWGLFHGSFLILERSPAGRLIDKLPVLLQHIYVLLVVMIAWVFFRSETLGYAWQYIGALVNFSAPDYLDATLFAVLNTEFYLALVIGLLFAMPVMPAIRKRFDKLISNSQGAAAFGLSSSKLVAQVFWMLALMIYSSAELISGAENPFLYFRF